MAKTENYEWRKIDPTDIADASQLNVALDEIDTDLAGLIAEKQSALDALSATVDTKAPQTALDALSNAVTEGLATKLTTPTGAVTQVLNGQGVPITPTDTPTSGSTLPLTSGGAYTALAEKVRLREAWYSGMAVKKGDLVPHDGKYWQALIDSSGSTAPPYAGSGRWNETPITMTADSTAEKNKGYAHVGGGANDYVQWVLPLVRFAWESVGGMGLNNYFSGKVFAKRENGTTAPMQVEFTAYSYYYGGYKFVGTKSAVNGDIVTFTYDGIPYIGVRYAGMAIYGAGVHLSGFWSGDMPFKLGIIPYYNTNTQAVLNAEVRDSIAVV